MSTQQTHELLAVLHHIAPGPSPIPLEGEALVAGFPAGGKLAGQPAVNPEALVGGPAGNGPGLAGPAAGDPSLLGGAAAKSPGETTPAPGAALNLSTDPTTADKGMLTLQGREESIGSRQWAWCIKSEEDAPDAGPSDPSKGKPKPVPAPSVLSKPLFIPQDLKQFPVVQDFSKFELLDPKDKTEALVFATTDNSNTQFAILALWVAQRREVPMERTLRLVSRRFQSSQSADGSWSYRYAFGGGESEGPAMDCVGLLGLAVGQGIAPAGQGAVNAGPDPAILNGFAALSRHVGVPAGRTHDLPLVNMYLLWSIERVAVLYGLPTIANKDWYRWGAEVLVANQALAGDWPADGGYPGQTPMANTCLALLFLRKANLVSDLTAALPFQPEDLTKSIEDKVAPKASPPPAAPPPPADPPAPPTGLESKPTLPIAPAGSGTAPGEPVRSPHNPGAGGGGEQWRRSGLDPPGAGAGRRFAAGGQRDHALPASSQPKPDRQSLQEEPIFEGGREARRRRRIRRDGDEKTFGKNPSACLTIASRRGISGILHARLKAGHNSRPHTKEVSQSIRQSIPRGACRPVGFRLLRTGLWRLPHRNAPKRLISNHRSDRPMGSG